MTRPPQQSCIPYPVSEAAVSFSLPSAAAVDLPCRKHSSQHGQAACRQGNLFFLRDGIYQIFPMKPSLPNKVSKMYIHQQVSRY
jgi:hypothetical protein